MTFYFHPEAWCLMKYRSDDGLEEELIWNSRDGVTPFMVTLRSGKTATHVDWQDDVRTKPEWRAPIGMRFFTDHTEESALEAARANVEVWWDHPDYPARTRYHSKEQFANMLAKEYIGTPTIGEVLPPAEPIVKEPRFGPLNG